MLAKSVSNPVC